MKRIIRLRRRDGVIQRYRVRTRAKKTLITDNDSSIFTEPLFALTFGQGYDDQSVITPETHSANLRSEAQIRKINDERERLRPLIRLKKAQADLQEDYDYLAENKDEE